MANTTTLAPKVGFAYDLTGDNRTVLKGFIGQSRWNSADTLADQENPVGLAQLRYAFVSCAAGQTTGCDLNGDRLVSSPAELGAFQSTQGGGGFVRVDRDLTRPTSNESLAEPRARDHAPACRAARHGSTRTCATCGAKSTSCATPATPCRSRFIDPGVDRVVGTADDQTFQTLALAAGTGTDRVYTNATRDNADFHTMEFALNRRFSNKWMMLVVVRLHLVDDAPRRAAARARSSYRPFDLMFGDNGKETDTLWNYKIIGRYVMPWDIGFSGSWKVQSGFNYARTISVTMPVEGARTIRVEPIDSNRYPTRRDPRLPPRQDVQLRQVRHGRRRCSTSSTSLNSGVPTTVRTTNTATAPFNEVTAILNPRVIRFGVRFQF